MKRIALLLSCALFLSAVGPITSASAGIRIWHRHHKDAAKTSAAPKPKSHRTIFHRSKTREQAAREEATFGMPGPKSVGTRHPQPGPAGVGAR